MPTVYLDTSAAVKRVLPEQESQRIVDAIIEVARADGVLITSALTRVEVSRTLRRRAASLIVDAEEAFRDALQGIAQAPITEVVVELARSIDPPLLRSLDAIHLATAIAVGADEVWTYDERLGQAAAAVGMRVRAPA